MNMNVSNLKISLAALLAGAALSTQVFAETNAPVSTPIVGFTTTTIKGTGASGQSSFASFVPVNLRKTPVYKGQGIATSTTVDLSGANFTSSLAPSSGYPTHYLLITSGSGEGYISDITANTTSSVTTADNLSSYITNGTSVTIVPHTKLSDVLGTGAGLLVNGGANTTAADNVQLVDSNGAIKVYYYKTGVGAGWKTSANGDASGLVVYPNEAILVIRKQASNVSVTQTGQVADQKSISVIAQNLNSVASGYPVAVTLTNLTPILTGGSTSTAADNVLVVNPTTGKLDVLYYKTGVGAGWKTTANLNADTTRDLSDGFHVRRKSSTPTSLVQTPSW